MRYKTSKVKEFIMLSLLVLGFLPIQAQTLFVPGKPLLAYWQVGSGNEDIIVLHGGPAAPHQYLRPEFDLLGKAAKVTYYDQRGCGESEKAETYVWQQQVKDLRRVKETVSKNKKVFLAGSSWGSTLALLYSYTYPQDVKGVILSGTYQWGGMQAEFVPSVYNYPEHSTQLMSEEALIPEQEVTGQIVMKPISVFREFAHYPGAPAFETLRSVISAPPLDSLSKIKLPVLIINGSRSGQDCMVDCVEEYMNILPNVKLFTIQGACHDPWLSDPDKFMNRCVDFINLL